VIPRGWRGPAGVSRADVKYGEAKKGSGDKEREGTRDRLGDEVWPGRGNEETSSRIGKHLLLHRGAWGNR